MKTADDRFPPTCTITAAPRSDPKAAKPLGWRSAKSDFDQEGWTIAHAFDNDPATAWYVYGQDPPTLGRHSGYWIDPAVWTVVDKYAEALPSPGSRTN